MLVGGGSVVVGVVVVVGGVGGGGIVDGEIAAEKRSTEEIPHGKLVDVVGVLVGGGFGDVQHQMRSGLSGNRGGVEGDCKGFLGGEVVGGG